MLGLLIQLEVDSTSRLADREIERVGCCVTDDPRRPLVDSHTDGMHLLRDDLVFEISYVHARNRFESRVKGVVEIGARKREAIIGLESRQGIPIARP